MYIEFHVQRKRERDSQQKLMTLDSNFLSKDYFNSNILWTRKKCRHFDSCRSVTWMYVSCFPGHTAQCVCARRKCHHGDHTRLKQNATCQWLHGTTPSPTLTRSSSSPEINSHSHNLHVSTSATCNCLGLTLSFASGARSQPGNSSLEMFSYPEGATGRCLGLSASSRGSDVFSKCATWYWPGLLAVAWLQTR